jgi:hypothetical protein
MTTDVAYAPKDDPRRSTCSPGLAAADTGRLLGGINMRRRYRERTQSTWDFEACPYAAQAARVSRLGFMSSRAALRRPVNVSVTCPVPTVRTDPGPPAGLSPWSARLLDQLSLTAWLPAALLVANVYLVAGMYLVRNPGADPTMANLTKVISAPDEKPVGVIIAVVSGVVLATLVTQSFEFAAIRFLEGYWGGSILAAAPTSLAIRLQRLRRWLTRRRADKLTRHAFRAAQARVAQHLGSNPDLASAVLLIGTAAPVDHLDPALKAEAENYYYARAWMVWAPPHLRHRASAVAIRLAAYPPRPSRLMPTQLGNTLRASEERLKGHVAGTQMRGYLYPYLGSIEPALMHQHTQYRNRLDMFAVMTVLCALLAPANALLIPGVLPTPAVVVATVSLLVLSFFSYRGAAAAAVDYGAVLVAIDAGIQRDEKGQAA